MEYLTHLAVLFAIYATLAIALDLAAGYTGLFSLAHAAFYGIGGYTAALLMLDFHLNFFIALLVAVALVVAVSGAMGAVFSRLKGDYYILSTVGFNFIIFTIFLNWQSVTGGPLGVPGIPRPSLLGFTFSDNQSFLALALVVLVIVYTVSRFIVQSSFGRVLKAIREDEEAISVFGYRTLYFKLAIFVVSAAIAAVGGAFLASYLRYIDPNSFALTQSIFLLAVIMLGGLGSLRGPVLGALILVLLPEALRFVGFSPDIAAQMRQLIYGLILVFLMLYRPQGIIGEYKI
jgi:branched-chain amino acid transport system permease protein